MSYLFYECSSLKSLPDISKWNVNNVTNMSALFKGCSSLIKKYINILETIFKNNSVFYESLKEETLDKNV